MAITQEIIRSEVPVINPEVADMLREALAPEIDPYDPDDTEAIMEEAKMGNAAAQYILGLALESVIPPRMADARAWYEIAAQKEYRPAQAKLRSLRMQ
jgi:TPR repeat protein